MYNTQDKKIERHCLDDKQEITFNSISKQGVYLALQMCQQNIDNPNGKFGLDGNLSDLLKLKGFWDVGVKNDIINFYKHCISRHMDHVDGNHLSQAIKYNNFLQEHFSWPDRQ